MIKRLQIHMRAYKRKRNEPLPSCAHNECKCTITYIILIEMKHVLLPPHTQMCCGFLKYKHRHTYTSMYIYVHIVHLNIILIYMCIYILYACTRWNANSSETSKMKNTHMKHQYHAWNEQNIRMQHHHYCHKRSISKSIRSCYLQHTFLLYETTTNTTLH